MGKTNTQRSRLHRQRLKEDCYKYEQYKSKDKERKRAERSKAKKLSHSEIERRKKLNRDRVKKCKLRKKAAANQAKPENDAEYPVYKTPQALGKAVGKVKCHLPQSPRKRKAVINKLASDHGIKFQKKTASGNKKLLSEDVQEKIKSFYCLDSVSRQSPGKRDFVIKRDDGKKEYMQKRHLLYSLKETHAIFQKENPNIKVGLSKFSSLRPKHVLLSSDMPKNVCLCQYHENVRLVCDCLNKEIANFPVYSSGFVDNAVCTSESEDCMMGRCNKCPKWLEDIAESCDPEVMKREVVWYQWERVDLVLPKGKIKQEKVIKKMKKICKEGTVGDAIYSLQSKLPTFLEHVFVKRQQASYFEKRIEDLKPNEAVVQVDFSENYTCQYQDEIQSAHWNQEQVTLFPVAVWTLGPDGKKVCESHVITSDELGHDKKSVAVFMSIVIDKFVKEKHSEVQIVYVFSDGPSSQFKNKYIVNFLHTLNSKLNIQWNYFATSHGKGAVDGIGGSVKRMVWNAVKSRKSPVVINAQTFSQEAAKLATSVAVSFVSKDQIDKMADVLCLKKCFNEAPSLPGISRFHCIEPENGYVKCRLYSNQNTHMRKAPIEVYPFDSDENDLSSEDFTDGEYGETDGGEDNDSAVDRDSVHSYDSQKSEEYHTNITSKMVVNEGIPDDLCSNFQQPVSMQLPYYMSTQVDAVVSGVISFSGSTLINNSDIHGLIGTHASPQQNWLSNFVIDNYLELIKLACVDKGISVNTIKWEAFEKGSIATLAKEMDSPMSKLLNQEVILIPCNPIHSGHWYLMAVLPKRKLVAVLDSLATDILKPTVKVRFEKMAEVLTAIDPNHQLDDWTFVYNTNKDIPQQNNYYDCGVYTCMYARCLAGLGPLIEESSVLEVRKHILLSLHRESLIEVPDDGIALEKYYAVHFEKKYYIGRALSIPDSSHVQVKFLHNSRANQFDWPKRDDIDEVHLSSVFYGPVMLHQSGPFTVPRRHEIEKIYNTIH